MELSDILSKKFESNPEPSMHVKINHSIKRSIDIVFGTVGLVASIPFVAVFAAATVYDSGFPIFFKQERIGYRGENITIYKVRTMHTGTEEKILNGEIKMSDNLIGFNATSPVYTRFGKLLDYTHLNELPQLWNVVKGEMSLVGNRPLAHYLVRSYLENDDFIERFNSKPGLTGYTQTTFRCERNKDSIIDEEKKYSDLYNNGKFLLEDLKIMVKTLQKYGRMFSNAKDYLKNPEDFPCS